MVSDLAIRAVRRCAGPESRVEPDGMHADRFRGRDIGGHIIADVDSLLRPTSELSQGRLEHLGIGLPHAEFVGVHPDVEEILDPESALESRQIATPTASRVRDQSDREALSLQHAEDLSDVREERRRSGQIAPPNASATASEISGAVPAKPANWRNAWICSLGVSSRWFAQASSSSSPCWSYARFSTARSHSTPCPRRSSSTRETRSSRIVPSRSRPGTIAIVPHQSNVTASIIAVL